jgi:hypothetical protein
MSDIIDGLVEREYAYRERGVPHAPAAVPTEENQAALMRTQQ